MYVYIDTFIYKIVDPVQNKVKIFFIYQSPKKMIQ